MLPFRKRPSMSEQVLDLMESTVACFPHVELSDSTASEWLKVWMELADKYRFARLKTAVNRLKFKLDYFPKPSEIQREIDALLQEERDAAKGSTTEFVSCGKCSIDGLLLVNDRGEMWDERTDKGRAVKVCDCKEAWRAKRSQRE